MRFSFQQSLLINTFGSVSVRIYAVLYPFMQIIITFPMIILMMITLFSNLFIFSKKNNMTIFILFVKRVFLML